MAPGQKKSTSGKYFMSKPNPKFLISEKDVKLSWVFDFMFFCVSVRLWSETTTKMMMPLAYDKIQKGFKSPKKPKTPPGCSLSAAADELMTSRWVWPLAERQVWSTQGGGCGRGTFSAAPLRFCTRAKTGSGGFPPSKEHKLCVLFLSGFQFSSASRLTCVWHKTSGCHQLLAKKSDWSFSNYCSKQCRLARNQMDLTTTSSGCALLLPAGLAEENSKSSIRTTDCVERRAETLWFWCELLCLISCASWK